MNGMKHCYSTKSGKMSLTALFALELILAMYFMITLILLLFPSLNAKCNGVVFLRFCSYSSKSFYCCSVKSMVGFSCKSLNCCDNVAEFYFMELVNFPDWPILIVPNLNGAPRLPYFMRTLLDDSPPPITSISGIST